MNNLLLKAVTDRNAKQLREERGGYNGIDSLTSEELEQYQAFEDMVIAMIGLNMSYQEIKAMAFRNKKTRQEGAWLQQKRLYSRKTHKPFNNNN